GGRTWRGERSRDQKQGTHSSSGNLSSIAGGRHGPEHLSRVPRKNNKARGSQLPGLPFQRAAATSTQTGRPLSTVPGTGVLSVTGTAVNHGNVYHVYHYRWEPAECPEETA